MALFIGIQRALPTLNYLETSLGCIVCKHIAQIWNVNKLRDLNPILLFLSFYFVQHQMFETVPPYVNSDQSPDELKWNHGNRIIIIRDLHNKCEIHWVRHWVSLKFHWLVDIVNAPVYKTEPGILWIGGYCARIQAFIFKLSVSHTVSSRYDRVIFFKYCSLYPLLYHVNVLPLLLLCSILVYTNLFQQADFITEPHHNMTIEGAQKYWKIHRDIPYTSVFQ